MLRAKPRSTGSPATRNYANMARHVLGLASAPPTSGPHRRGGLYPLPHRQAPAQRPSCPRGMALCPESPPSVLGSPWLPIPSLPQLSPTHPPSPCSEESQPHLTSPPPLPRQGSLDTASLCREHSSGRCRQREGANPRADGGHPTTPLSSLLLCRGTAVGLSSAKTAVQTTSGLLVSPAGGEAVPEPGSPESTPPLSTSTTGSCYRWACAQQ